MKKLNLAAVVLLSAGMSIGGISYASISVPPVIQLGGLTINHASSTQLVTTGKLDASAIGGQTSLEYIINCQYSVSPVPTLQDPAVMGHDRGDNYNFYVNQFLVDGLENPGIFSLTQASGKIMIDGMVDGAAPQLIFYNYDAADDLKLSNCTAQLKYNAEK